ncbi:hypothetical protein Tco_0017060 [Tanacetum coccineum]
MIERRTIGGFQVELPLQHLPLSPAIFSGFPGRLVAGETQPGRLVARDKLKGKARQGYFPGRLSRATWWGPHCFRQTISRGLLPGDMSPEKCF